MLYFYFSKNDINKEKIDKCESSSYNEALEYFSKKKRLSKQRFQEMFEIGITQNII